MNKLKLFFILCLMPGALMAGVTITTGTIGNTITTGTIGNTITPGEIGITATSGTIGYASTSGTATFAPTSGTSLYSTTSGTGVYATTSGSSNFSSTAAYAATSGTAGTVVNVSGIIPGIQAFGINATSGTNVITSSDAIFASNMVGWSASLMVSSTNKIRVTGTIASVLSGTAATLSLSSTFTTSAGILIAGSDCTPIVQTAINNLAGTGGQLVFPSGFYVFSGPLQDGTLRNSILILPNPSQSSGIQQYGIHFIGQGAPSIGESGYFSYTSSTNGTVFYAMTESSGTWSDPAFISGLSPDRSSVNTSFRDIEFRTPVAGSLSAVLKFNNLSNHEGPQGGTLDIYRCAFTKVWPFQGAGSIPLCASSTDTAIVCPGSGNGEYCPIRDTLVLGYWYGVRTYDGVFLTNDQIAQCYNGVYIDQGAGVTMEGGQFIADVFPLAATQSNVSVIQADSLYFENTGNMVAILSDSNGYLCGHIAGKFANDTGPIPPRSTSSGPYLEWALDTANPGYPWHYNFNAGDAMIVTSTTTAGAMLTLSGSGQYNFGKLVLSNSGNSLNSYYIEYRESPNHLWISYNETPPGSIDLYPNGVNIGTQYAPPTHTLTVTGSANTTGNMDVAGILTVGGNATVSGTLIFSGTGTAPSNTSTPIIWVNTSQGGQNYRVPLYQ